MTVATPLPREAPSWTLDKAISNRPTPSVPPVHTCRGPSPPLHADDDRREGVDTRAELRAAVGALIGLGVGGGEGAVAGGLLGASVDPDAPTAAEVVAAGLLEDLPDDSSALVLAIEHLWAVPLRDAVRDAGGIVVAHRSFTPEDLVAFGLLAGVEAELDATDAEGDDED